MLKILYQISSKVKLDFKKPGIEGQCFTTSCQVKPWISDFKFAEGQMLIGQPF